MSVVSDRLWLVQVQSRDLDWDPPFFLMDCAPAEASAVHMVFGPEKLVFFCHWHVQKAWQKQLAAKVKARVRSCPVHALEQKKRYAMYMSVMPWP